MECLVYIVYMHMMRHTHHTHSPHIHHTYVTSHTQTYTQDSEERLMTDIERAQREGFRFGAKLVRGAYMQLERQRAADRGYPSPIHDTLEETHANYDRYA